MPSLRQKLRVSRTSLVETLSEETPISVENISLRSRNASTGLWSATTASNSTISVKKLGVNSGYGLDLPGLTVKDGVGRFSN